MKKEKVRETWSAVPSDADAFLFADMRVIAATDFYVVTRSYSQ
jgi:hypothetical protein